MARRRLDVELVRRGLVPSRTEARELLERGVVTVAGRSAAKPSTLVGEDEALDVRERGRRFVSRGGHKLEAALGRFAIDVTGRECLDVGASTGGFTDCLLQRGAARVAAVDVGYGQLAWSLRNDPRVIVLDRTNARRLGSADLPFAPSVVVADLSFISLSLVVPALVPLCGVPADLVLLVKPQFEAGPEGVGQRGVVRDPETWRAAIARIARACRTSGAEPHDVVASPLLGPAGNAEFLLWAGIGGEAAALRNAAVDDAIRVATLLRGAT